MIYFVGAGSGAADLITIRGRRLLDTADVVIYAGSLVNPELLEGVRSSAEIHNSAYLNLDQVMEIMFRAQQEGKNLVRLHTGDPSLFGAVREQMDRLSEQGIPFEVCPGVSSFSGAAASLKAEYTLPGVSQTVILTRMEGRTPVPSREKMQALAAHGATMVIFLSAGMTERLQEELLASGGYGPETPCAVVYKATWPEEKIIRTKLAHLAEETERAGIRKTALILVGDFLGSDYELSKLYDKHFETEYRKAETQEAEHTVIKLGLAEVNQSANRRGKPETGPKSNSVKTCGDVGEMEFDKPSVIGRRVIRTTALCFTDRGEKLGRTLQEVRLLRHGRDFSDTKAVTEQLFATEDAILFISASGIAVRSIAGCIGSKQRDPAVLVMDDAGQYVIPILSGHLGGANEMAATFAEQIGGRAVITTASDSSGMESIDMRAKRSGYHVNDMAAAKALTAAMLAGRPVEIRRIPDSSEPVSGGSAGSEKTAGKEPAASVQAGRPADIEDTAGQPLKTKNTGAEESAGAEADALEISMASPAVTLTLSPKRYVLGIGCRKGTDPEKMLAFVRKKLAEQGISENRIFAVCSIEDKADEDAIHRTARYFRCPFLVYTAEQLEQMPGWFTGSDFVKQTVGTDNVCERSAMAGCGSRFDGFVFRKTAGQGMTLAAARRKPNPEAF